MSDPLLPLATWLGTYLLHSTVLFGFAWAIDRLRLLRALDDATPLSPPPPQSRSRILPHGQLENRCRDAIG